MKATGLIVEYNPFHYGHQYHFLQSKEVSGADCTVAIMSGNFLQRGEPAIIDKWHRAQIALQSGIDIVLEIPYVFAVQNSDLFAKGAVLSLDALGVDSICFGSEDGSIEPFVKAHSKLQEHEKDYHESLHEHLKEGLSFPEASRHAYHKIGLGDDAIDLGQPNNILGFSYTKTILEYNLNIKPLTIQRKQSGYHDETIEHKIASATSIRKEILSQGYITEEAKGSLPPLTVEALEQYRDLTGSWHEWELYFPLLQYKISTMSPEELGQIHGVEEGLEYRFKQTIHKANNFQEWMNLIKTKRYTWTRLQRTLTHILTNTKTEEIESINTINQVPYVRLLGMTNNGQQYISQQKKDMNCPLITPLHKGEHPFLTIEERAVDSYLSMFKPTIKRERRNREFMPPILP
ncbi:nucleotidyltransferase [Pontibacillus sp. HMF3514]|uniref:nucleotidyltransferase n=1 Tax=Pontibacillus sp. HMF3514 TaxID=2692425 RepID=UPI0013204143|nr:nucleotidyltransferase [Pontibacillus sp. HMF3514]QHE52084.1 nucleotidyltransferase [Pontibacillus sp. HMF3514]